MGTKTISIMDEVYDMLAKARNKGESFSDVIRRSVSNSKDILEVAGAWSDLSNEDFKLAEKTANSLRRSKRRYLN